jgi:hypothetical protein
MNEITKRLFDKALDKAVPETWTTLSHEQVTKLSQVLAELIVRECANYITEYYDSRDEAYYMKKHFGVEE